MSASDASTLWPSLMGLAYILRKSLISSPAPKAQIKLNVIRRRWVLWLLWVLWVHSVRAVDAFCDC